MLKATPFLVVIVFGALQTGCDRSAPKRDGHSGAKSTVATTNRIDIPASVRSNLGITFVTVERRRVEETLRVPGRFEYQPSARREYRSAVPGRVEILVEQFERIDADAVLYRIDSPAWREMQEKISTARSRIESLEARERTFEPLLAAHQQHEQSLQESVAVWDQRVAQLESLREAGGGRIEELTQARAALASTGASLAETLEKDAQLVASRQETEAELRGARARLDFLLDAAAAISGCPRAELETVVETDSGSRPRWATLQKLEIRATDSGVIEELGMTRGSWADEKSLVLSVVRTNQLRFRASALQSDLGAIRQGLLARIVSPTPTRAGRAIPLDASMEASLSLGLAGDPHSRTLDLFAVPKTLLEWARPGVTAQLEIVLDATSAPELAIPLAAVQRDGLTPVIFRRAPDNPNEAIRIEADLGSDDGRWVTLLSGVRDGDEVVLDGAFQLMLATSGSMPKGGHFHADGTFHEGED